MLPSSSKSGKARRWRHGSPGSDEYDETPICDRVPNHIVNFNIVRKPHGLIAPRHNI